VVGEGEEEEEESGWRLGRGVLEGRRGEEEEEERVKGVAGRSNWLQR